MSARHPELWQRVIAQANEGRLPHALLLAGPRGTGKLEFAQALAAQQLCEAPAGAARPCNACRGCTQRQAGTHPNLMVLAPAEDKRDIAIDDIRDLLSRLSLSAHYGGKKIAIVAPADALNASGANALLKTIEEPPPATHLLLVSERWRALPATLRSRCQLLRFALPRASQDAASPDDAQWARALAELSQGKFAALSLVQGYKRDDAQAVLEGFQRIATHWLQAQLAPGAGKKAAPPPAATPDSLQKLYGDTIEGLEALARNNAAPALLLESIMIKWAGRTA